jgi:hypothetical protein
MACQLTGCRNSLNHKEWMNIVAARTHSEIFRALGTCQWMGRCPASATTPVAPAACSPKDEEDIADNSPAGVTMTRFKLKPDLKLA